LMLTCTVFCHRATVFIYVCIWSSFVKCT